ncbi:MAG: amidophosphoribosyltransferase [Chloroflexi bacterium]|nr:amidophosphoribosyltransferase [Chloroflexota bacterium]
MQHSCGVFGIYAPGEDVARITFFALYALQHRGQESAGIATADGRHLAVRTGMGLVSQVFTEENIADLVGDIAIGHVRYSTTGASKAANAQPFVVESPLGPLGLAHNGNVINAGYLRQELAERGCRFVTSTDSEVIAHLIAQAPGDDWPTKIRRALPRLNGAYSLTLLTHDQLFAVRDPLGVRPLVLGRLGNGYVIASESCALDTIRAQFVQEIQPGELAIVDRHGYRIEEGVASKRSALCVFEHIYFARPDSVIRGILLYQARERMGEQLWAEHPVDADLVTAVPDSAMPAGIGFSRASGIPFSETLVKNRYIGRTFIQPDQRLRDAGVMLKFNPLQEVLDGKRVVVVDDSIVRGTTTPPVVSLLRKAGAREVHLRICAPPIRFPCFFGVDMATRRELIGARLEVKEIERYVGADSLGFLSHTGLIKAVGQPKDRFCMACFNGDYPVPVQLEMDKFCLEGM